MSITSTSQNFITSNPIISYPQPTATEPSINVNGTLTPRRDQYGSVLVVTTPDPGVPINVIGRAYHPASDIKIYTGHVDDKIDIKVMNDRVVAIINGQAVNLDINASNSDGNQGKLFIDSGGGDDNVTIGPDVKVNVTIHTGPGKDTVSTGGGYAQVHLGDGNDTGKLGSGGGELHGENGDDILTGGTGSNFINGGAGKNTIMGGKPSDSSRTAISAVGTSDTIIGRSDDTYIQTKAQFTVIKLYRQFDTEVDIHETAGNTETNEYKSRQHEADGDIRFSGRFDPTKDRRIRVNLED
ncbi:calcium-binding protein [Pseudomonas sp. Xaverov 259]|uniref:calcium-binding protein n=1 Tax=Pseudomonas sp. Xaverov 259 TaxID=2666086 RepID=UPI001C5A9902|nr:hypothetical protein [Pseudomonas sp. Xaverov 259]